MVYFYQTSPGAVLLCGELHVHWERDPDIMYCHSQMITCLSSSVFLCSHYSICITPSPIVDTLLQPSRFFALPYVLLFFLLFYFTNWSFLCNISEVGHISKAAVCRAVRKVWLALKRVLHIFVVFPGYKPTSDIKGLVLRIAFGRCRNQLRSFFFYILPHYTSKYHVNYLHDLHSTLTSDRHR